jgi:hypothetical protein
MKKDKINRTDLNDGNFATISRAALINPKLTEPAFRLLVCALNNAEKWDINMYFFGKRLKWSNDKISNAIKNLEILGYLSREEIRKGGGGKGSGTGSHLKKQYHYTINESPSSTPINEVQILKSKISSQEFGIKKADIDNSNSNKINPEDINSNEKKKEASKLYKSESWAFIPKIPGDTKLLIELGEMEKACWPDFFEVEVEEEFDPQDHLPSDDHSIQEAPVFPDFPYEEHMANEQEERFKSFIEKDSEIEYLPIQVDKEWNRDRSIFEEESIQRNEEQDSTTEISISTLNGKADLTLEEKKVVFALLVKLFKQRSEEFSTEHVMNESIKAYAQKLHNADFMPSGKVVNNWHSYLSAAIQGVINDLNKVELESENENLKKQIRNMKAQGYDYVNGMFVEATKVPGLKYGGS